MTAQKKTQLSLRIPKDLSLKLKDRAEGMGVSINAHVLMVLSQELSKNDQK